MARRKTTIDRAMEGGEGIVSVLEAEHEEISELMEAIVDTETDSRKRRGLYEELRTRWMLHARGEELEFYSECRSDPHLRTMADESLDDHREMEQLLIELDRAPMHATDWLATFERLQHMIEEHVEFEENELFPRVQEYFDDEQLAEMEEAYHERRELLEAEPEQLEPHERPSV